MRSKTIPAVVAAAVAFGTAGDALAAGYALAGVGARANGMGGAFHAVADDATAIYWNPGALATLKGWNAVLGGAGIVLSGTFKPIDPLTGYDERVSTDLNADIAPVPYGAIAWGNGKIGAALGFYVPHGLKLDWDLFDLPRGYNDDISYPEYDWTVDLKVIDVQPTLALRVNDRVFFGAGLNVHITEATLQRIRLTATGLSYPINYLPTDVVINGDGIGYDAVAGFFVEPSKRTSLALVYRFGSTVEIDGTATLTSYMPEALDYARKTGDKIQIKTDATTELNIPSSISCGGAVRPNESSLLSASVTWTNWSAFESLVLDFVNDDDEGNPLMVAGLAPLEDSALTYNWEDSWRFSVGGELSASAFAFRAGYYYETSATIAETLSPLIPDVNPQQSFNFGLGAKLTDRIRIDGIFEYFLEMNETIDVAAPADAAPADYENLTGEYTAAINAFNIQLTYGL